MKKMTNATHIEGFLYSHKLELKTAGATSKNPGAQFIKGNVDIAVDDAMTNVISVYYTYVAPVFPAKNGKPERENPTFTTLKQIIDGALCNVTQHGEAKAAKLRIDSAIALNEFYTDNGKPDPDLVSMQRNEGGFIHVVSALGANETRNTFDVDIIINRVRRIDADPERGTPEKSIISGTVFNFANKILPIELSAVSPDAMDYFESLEPSNNHPVFTRLRGRQISETVVRKSTEESAFGSAFVREVKSSRKDFIITWAQPEPYAWDDETTITANELVTALGNRQTDLAALKQNYLDFKGGKSAPAATITAGGTAFKF